MLDRDNIAMLIDFAKAHDLAILADEVYQENIYLQGDRFVSFARVMVEQGETDVSLFSFHSCSKGFLGECGQRGGYMEVRNIPADVVAQITKLQSVSLCSNLTGQVATYCMVRPPKPGEPSYALYAQERDGMLGELKTARGAAGRRAQPDPGHPVQRRGRGDVRLPDGSRCRPAGRTTSTAWRCSSRPASASCRAPGSVRSPGRRTSARPSSRPRRQIEKVVERLAAFHAAYR